MRITALLLTRFFNTDADFHEWCRHHLSLGVDHIHVFDNDSSFNLRAACEEYGDLVSYERVTNPHQYQLYNTYIGNCDADYVMPIDDDEYLWLSTDIGSLHDAIAYYTRKFGKLDVLGIRWLFKFPHDLLTERTSGVLEYCTEENDYLATRFYAHANHIIKCLVRKDAFVRYMDADESSTRNHIPLSTGIDGAMMCNGKITFSQHVYWQIDDERIRLIHCPYKGYSEYISKRENHVTVSQKIPRHIHNRAFDLILDKLK